MKNRGTARKLGTIPKKTGTHKYKNNATPNTLGRNKMEDKNRMGGYRHRRGVNRRASETIYNNQNNKEDKCLQRNRDKNLYKTM